MLKSFKSYIRESRDDDEQVLRDLLSSGLISKSEFYTLAKESGIPLHSGDFDYRYTVTISVPASDIAGADDEMEMDFLTREVSTIDQTYVAYTMLDGEEHVSYQHSILFPIVYSKWDTIDRRRRNRYILEIASNLEEDELREALDQKLLEQGIRTREIELH
jgi:hypothetical protein